MKTLANCTPREFAVQTLKISQKIRNYKDGMKKATELVEKGESNFFNIINYIFGDNVDATMEICGDICFMSADKFAALDPESPDGIDGISLVLSVVNTPRVETFFTTLFKLKAYSKML